MADYSMQIAELIAAAEVCQRHTIIMPVNGIQPQYPRWPEAWKACEIVWRNYLEMQTMAQDGSDERDRRNVMIEAYRLRSR